MNDEHFLAAVEEYNRSRNLADKAVESLCYAPFASLYFDQLGNVRACCQNTEFPVGNIRDQTIDEIWHGEKIQALRDSLARCDLRMGCKLCEWEVMDGSHLAAYMRLFDGLPVLSPHPEFPQQMEFSISNTCNLECVMCNGEWSSSIRTRREKRPPLEKVYGDAFFQQLRSYLPHLSVAKFFGGEPFLAHESFRIWDIMIELGLDTPCHVTTNGTQFNAKVERVLQTLPVSLSISMDGVSKETVERIRKNAVHEELMENLRRFRRYTREKHTSLSFTYCLMRDNWQEFGDFLLFGDEWGCPVYVNVVTSPRDHSLHTLPRDALERIVQDLEQRDDEMNARLRRNRRVWREELNRLRGTLRHVGEDRYFRGWGAALLESSQDVERRKALADEMIAKIVEWSGRPPVLVVDCDARHVVTAVDVAPGGPFDRPPLDFVGKPIAELQNHVIQRFGRRIDVVRNQQSERWIDNIETFGADEVPEVEVRGLTVPKYDDSGTLSGLRIFVGVRSVAPVGLVQIEQHAREPGGE